MTVWTNVSNLLRASSKAKKMAVLCREFGISRKTGYKVFNRYKEAPIPPMRIGVHMKKLLKWAGVIVGVYVVFVVIFETVYLGYLQPSFEEGGIPMLDIVTKDDAGNLNKRRLARFESSEGHLYVSAHHWTRGWYHELMANPEVSAEIDGVAADYVAVTVEGNEFDRVAAEYPLPFVARFLMGFPPTRDIVRLDPALN